MNAKSVLNSKPRRLIRPWDVFKAVAVVAFFVFMPAAAWCQGTTATLNGTVQDATGAVVVNAKIEVKNEATGDTRHTTSNDAGFFAFSGLPSGDYDVLVESTGFNSVRKTGIHLDPGDTRTVREINLAVGAANASVTVTAAVQTLTIDSGDVSHVISAEDITHLSVEGRDVTELIKTLPGFTINPNAGGTVQNAGPDPSQVTVRGGSGFYSANGTLQSSLAILSDGADITDPGDFGGTLQTINYDQVAEVKVQTSSFSADEARGPIVISAVGKSGGAQYHGSLYTYARTNQLDSTDWLAKYSNQQKPPDRQIYPGFTFGGPIRIPGTRFNHDKKLTFFVGAEDYVQKNAYAYGNASSALMDALVPTANMRQGNFSPAELQQYLGPSYTPIAGGSGCTGTYANVCYRPQTGPGGQTLSNGNIGPYLDPGAMQEINAMPLPNVASTGQYNWIHTNIEDNNQWQARGRIDYAISENNKLFAVYNTQRGKTIQPQLAYYALLGPMGAINTPGGGILNPTTSEMGSLNLTSIIRPTLTNEFYLAGAWVAENFSPKDPEANQGGANGFAYQGLWNNGSKALPWLEDFGYDLGPLSLNPDPIAAAFQRKWVRSAGDNLTKVLGAHTIRVGMFFQIDTQKQLTDASISFLPTNGDIGQYYVGGQTTNLDPNVNNGANFYSTASMTDIANSYSGGNYLADFMEGQIFSYSQTNYAPISDMFFFNVDEYVQDHWRVNRRLTIDAGLRFEHLTPWGDAHGVGMPVWSPAAYTNPVSTAAPGFVWHAIDKSVPNAGFKTRWSYVEPRVGFSLDLYGAGNSVLRGGFGVYRSQEVGAVQPYSAQRTATVQQTVLSQINLQAATATTGVGGFAPDQNFSGVDGSDDERPQTYTWNLAVDQRLPANSLLEIGYVGNHSNNLPNAGSGTLGPALDNINALPLGALYGPQPGTGTVYPFFPPTGAGNGATNNAVINLNQATIDSFRTYPLYDQLHIDKHTLYSNYNGLQASWIKQQGKLRYGLNYTFSHALGVQGSSINGGNPVNPFNVKDNYRDAAFDRRHVFNATYSYDFGTVIHNKWIGPVTNGWELSGITTIQGGSPLQSSISPNFGITGTINVPQGSFGVGAQALLGTQDVSLQPTLSCNPGTRTQSHQYINATCFSLSPNLGQNGAYRFPRITGPAYTDSDVTAGKTFKVTDKSSLQFRFASFNFLNHANTTFAPLDENAYTLNFNGTFTSTSLPGVLASSKSQNPGFGLAPLRVGRRIMEMSLKLSF